MISRLIFAIATTALIGACNQVTLNAEKVEQINIKFVTITDLLFCILLNFEATFVKLILSCSLISPYSAVRIMINNIRLLAQSLPLHPIIDATQRKKWHC